MVQPLTKRRSNGELYTRRPSVEAQIDAALKLDLATLRRRLEIVDRQATNYLGSECLVHLIREAMRTGNQDRISPSLPVLLDRCEANLRKKIPEGVFFDAARVRDEILSQFSELLAEDGTGTNPNELDFFEVSFNQAFRAFRIDLIQKEKNRLEHSPPLPRLRADDKEESDADLLARLSQAARTPATQESHVFFSELWEAIYALPPEERRAVVLCCVMGYREESQDPEIVTAATLCKCSGRTIRNRLARAAVKLTKFKENS